MRIKEVTENDFIKMFDDYNRSNNFSIKGRIALFNYLNEIYSEEEPFKMDVIALCCEFSEYEDTEEYLNNYDTDLEYEDFSTNNKIDYESFENALEEEISNKTTLIKLGRELNEGFIIANY